ncbi:MAG: thioredoxin [Bacteroidales bacterium]|nr:thioredoxin [Bacteroidales bacterium]
MALEITSNNYDALVSEGKLIVIDFWATWCGPCRALTPIIDELANEYEGKAIITKCNVDTEKDLAMKFQVMSIPKVVFIKEGEVKDLQMGLTSKEVIEEKIKKLL